MDPMKAAKKQTQTKKVKRLMIQKMNPIKNHLRKTKLLII